MNQPATTKASTQPATTQATIRAATKEDFERLARELKEKLDELEKIPSAADTGSMRGSLQSLEVQIAKL